MNYNLVQRINNSKMGQRVEELSSKYAPRPSDIIKVPFEIIMGSFLFGSWIPMWIAESIAPSEYNNVEDIHKEEDNLIFAVPFELAAVGGVFCATVSYGLGEVVSYPIKKIEDYLIGERSENNIFNYMFGMN